MKKNKLMSIKGMQQLTAEEKKKVIGGKHWVWSEEKKRWIYVDD